MARVVPGRVSEAMFRRELLPWTLLGLTMGLVEGATAAVLLKQRFAATAEPIVINFAVAFVSGVPAVSNVMSFVWANIAHARPRVQLLVIMQCAFALAVGFVGFAPVAASGVLVTVLAVLAARTLWAGILTVRASVWIANYPRGVLGRITGRFVIASSLALAASAGGSGWAVESATFDTRWLYACAAIAGLAAAWRYRALRVRREHRLLEQERSEIGRTRPFSLRMLREVLRSDAAFTRYMFWMSVYGAGNLMLTAQLVVLLTDELAIPPATQIALLSVVPLVVLPIAVPFWSRLFDATHVIVYRAQQAWVTAMASGLLAAGCLSGSRALLWLGSLVYGVALAGASLGWNLGHHDFAAPGRAQHYMGVHVTLTGIRGMIAPPLGIAAYTLLHNSWPGSGHWSLLLPLALIVTGALGFTRMRRSHEAR